MELNRKVLILEAIEDIILDYNYHYELMKEMYKCLDISNHELAFQTHEKGFKVDNKIYKLFTHQLFLENANYTKSGINIKKGARCRLTVSGVKEIVQHIVFGAIERGCIELFNKSYKLVEVQNDKKVNFNNITLYKVRNPIVATRQDEQKKTIFISPFEENYYKVLANNLKRKYKLIYNKDYEGDLYFDIEDTFNIKKRLISNIKEKYMLIGYSNFELYLVADKDMQKVAYYCGLGGNNALGMGMTTFITSRRD